MLTVRKAMTPHLISVSHRASVHEAEQLMLEKRIRHLPVLDDHGDVIGMLSQRDLHVGMAANMTLGQLMSAPVQFVHVETPLRSAIYKMLEKKISCLLIADDNDEAIGIITTDDLLWQLAHVLDEEAEHDQPLRHVFNLQAASRFSQQIADTGI